MNKTLSYVLTFAAGVVLGGALVVCVCPKRHHHHDMRHHTRMERPLPPRFHEHNIPSIDRPHMEDHSEFKHHEMMEHFMNHQKCKKDCLEKETADEIRSCVKECEVDAHKHMGKVHKNYERK